MTCSLSLVVVAAAAAAVAAVAVVVVVFATFVVADNLYQLPLSSDCTIIIHNMITELEMSWTERRISRAGSHLNLLAIRCCHLANIIAIGVKNWSAGKFATY